MRTVRALALGTAIAAALAVVVPAGSRGDPSSTPLSCPKAYTGDEDFSLGLVGLAGRSGDPDLPKVYGPAGFDAGDSLAPRRTPTRAIVCSYAAGPNHDITPAPNPLTEEWEVPGRLDRVARDLSSAPEYANTGCSDMGGEVTRQLVGLEYDDTAVWVSVTDEPNGCIPASNGSFRAGGVGQLVAEAAQMRDWVRPTRGRGEICGEAIVVSRFGAKRHLVPGRPTTLSVCRDGDFAGALPVTSRLRGELLDELGSLKAAADVRRPVPRCGDRSAAYFVVVRYGSGPDVLLSASAGCDRDIVDNGDLAAPVSRELAELLETATTQQ